MSSSETFVIHSSTDYAYELFKKLLKEYGHDSRSAFDSIEILWNTTRGTSDAERGMKLMMNGECVVRVTNALCGYSGTGVGFSVQLLELLGFPITNGLRYDLARARHIRFELLEDGWDRKVLQLSDDDNVRSAKRRFLH